jgi:predicted SAM-dependent methyltransferase
VIEPILERLEPEVIVEIGSDKGDNTKNLLEFCEKHGGRLHVIDPVPKYDVSEWQERYGERFVFHRGLSLEVLPEIERFDAVLIDGDHNWYTVFNELRLLERLSGDRGFPLVMLHDVGWPYGRRDLYYAPGTIPEEHRQPHARMGMTPGSSGLAEAGGLNRTLDNALHEGGPRNGVLTAVEDFLDATEQQMEFVQVPGLHGLGILAPSELVKRNGELADFLATLGSSPPGSSAGLIEQLEKARLRSEMKVQGLAERLEEARLEAQASRAYRKQLELERENVRRLTHWAEALDEGISSLLASRRWRIGSALSDLSRRTLPGRRRPEAPEAVRKAQRQFRAWKKGHGSRVADSGGETTPPVRRSVGNATLAGSREEARNVSGRLGPEHEDGIKRVQVGCGPHNIMEDWWNVDIREFAGVDAVMDATKPWPYKDLEYVYGEHFLEHLTLDGAVQFFKHAGNSLKVGGVLRLSTPNLEWVLHTHYPYGEAGPDDIVSGTLQMNRAFHGWGHQFLYSRGMLEYVLREMGFEGISFYSYSESDVPALKNVERHGKFSVDDGRPNVIIAEARKGERPIEPSPEFMVRIQRNYLNVVHPDAH